VASLQSSVPRPPPSSRLTIRDPQKRRDTQNTSTWRAKLSGFCNRRQIISRIACRALDDCASGGTQDLCWFGPPKSNTLRLVRAAVLFALIRSRGYKWAIEGAWS
jgi:hypothetical protein